MFLRQLNRLLLFTVQYFAARCIFSTSLLSMSLLSEWRSQSLKSQKLQFMEGLTMSLLSYTQCLICACRCFVMVFFNNFGLLGIAACLWHSLWIGITSHLIHFQVALSVISLWDFMQCRLVVTYVSGPTDWFHLQRSGRQSWTSWPLQMTPSITCTFPYVASDPHSLTSFPFWWTWLLDQDLPLLKV